MAGRRVDLQTAAELLGISSDAVRKRAKRGTIPYETGVDGKLYVWVDEASPGETDDYPREAGEVLGAVPVRDDLLEDLREQVAFLRRELEARTEEARRKDHIIMSLTQRVPELEAGNLRGEPHGAETVAEGEAGTSAPPDREAGVQRRSWWRRWFGFYDRGGG